MPKFAEDLAREQADPMLAKGVAVGGDVSDVGPVRAPTEGPARAALGASSVLRLQRTIGNAGTTAYLQRDAEEGHEGHDHDGGADRSPVHNVIGSGGTPLDQDTRAEMEGHLGTDLGDVRLHVDRPSAESVQAAAYTVGNDVVLHPDHYSPGTPAAQRTLAHELTHVVQQRSGPVAGTEREGGIKVSDPSDRFEVEAEASADRFTSGATQPQSLSATAGASVQRESESGEEEDEEVQTLALQREYAGVQRESESGEEEDEEVQTLALQREEEDEEESEEG